MVSPEFGSSTTTINYVSADAWLYVEIFLGPENRRIRMKTIIIGLLVLRASCFSIDGEFPNERTQFIREAQKEIEKFRQEIKELEREQLRLREERRNDTWPRLMEREANRRGMPLDIKSSDPKIGGKTMEIRSSGPKIEALGFVSLRGCFESLT